MMMQQQQRMMQQQQMMMQQQAQHQAQMQQQMQQAHAQQQQAHDRRPRVGLVLRRAPDPPERASFREVYTGPSRGAPLLSDAFRLVHGDARGQFTYWSQRSRARPPNRGLRLDYFLLGNQGVPRRAVGDGRVALAAEQEASSFEYTTKISWSTEAQLDSFLDTVDSAMGRVVSSPPPPPPVAPDASIAASVAARCSVP
mgnify:CR=1 FL=1